MTVNGSRSHGLDLLRGIAALWIVGCHLGMNPHTRAAECLLHFTDFFVAVFACVSGYLLAVSLTRESGACVCAIIRKRAARLLKPYLIWSLIFLVASPVFNLLTGKPILNPKFQEWTTWLRIIFDGQAALHLWFLVHLFYITVLLVLIKYSCVAGILNRWLAVGLSAGLIAISGLCGGNAFTYYGVRLYAFVLLGWAIFGFLPAWRRVPLVVWGLLTIALGLIHVLGLPGSRFWYDYILVIPLLVLTLVASIPSTRIGKFLAEKSLSVYLVHPLICAGVAVVAKRLYPPPFSFVSVALVWIVDAIIAIFAAVIIERICREK